MPFGLLEGKGEKGKGFLCPLSFFPKRGGVVFSSIPLTFSLGEGFDLGSFLGSAIKINLATMKMVAFIDSGICLRGNKNYANLLK